MGNATDTGKLADAPSPGAAALMEALAAFSGAHDACIHGYRARGGQTGAPPKTVAQVLGEIPG